MNVPETSVIEDALARVLMRAYIDALTTDDSRKDGRTACADRVAQDEKILRGALFSGKRQERR